MERGPRPTFTLIAHRGYPARYPENTLLGFEQALAAGARFIEADVQLSADAEPFVFHDRSLSRLCGVEKLFYQLDGDQLRRCHPFDPQRFGNRFRQIPLLSLAELVALLQRHPHVTLFLELKRAMQRVLPPEQAVAQVLPLLAAVRNQVVLISFSIKLLQHAQRQGWARLAPVLTHWYQIGHRAVIGLNPEWLFLDYQRVPLGLGQPSGCAPMALYELSHFEQALNLAGRGFGWIETDSIGEMLQQQRAAVDGND